MQALGNNQNQMLTQTDINIYIFLKSRALNVYIRKEENLKSREPSIQV